MRTQGPVQTITEAFKNQSNRLGPNLGKKNIPSKKSTSKPDKPLSERKVKNLGINPPSFQSPLSEKKEISIALWAHWSGKNQEDVKASYTQLEKVNGSALLTIQKFIAEGNQVHACQIPGVIVLTEQGIFSNFPSRLSELLEKALSGDESLRNQIYQSDGILKTPIVITRISKFKKPSLDGLSDLSVISSQREERKVRKTGKTALKTEGHKPQHHVFNPLFTGPINDKTLTTYIVRVKVYGGGEGTNCGIF